MRQTQYTEEKKVTVIFPCRNEEQAIASCIESVQQVFDEHGIHGEIIVSDSSNDKSTHIAKQYGVRIIEHDQVGYGAAYLEAFPYARGEYVVLIDADGTYNSNDILLIVDALSDGADMVLGNRFGGGMDKGAMPFLNRYVGNPTLSFLCRVLFNVPYQDVHCGLRGIKRQKLESLQCSAPGMEFASEIVLKAVQQKLHITEVSVQYHKRIGTSKLRPITDGMRHIHCMLAHRL